MQTYARRQPAFQNRRAAYGQPAIRPSGIEDVAPAPDPSRDSSTWSEAETVSVMNTAGQLIGTAGSTIQAIINGNNAAARQQLASDTAIRLAQINHDAAVTNEPVSIGNAKVS